MCCVCSCRRAEKKNRNKFKSKTFKWSCLHSGRFESKTRPQRIEMQQIIMDSVGAGIRCIPNVSQYMFPFKTKQILPQYTPMLRNVCRRIPFSIHKCQTLVSFSAFCICIRHRLPIFCVSKRITNRMQYVHCLMFHTFSALSLAQFVRSFHLCPLFPVRQRWCWLRFQLIHASQNTLACTQCHTSQRNSNFYWAIMVNHGFFAV